jgi:pimeloyl-ACP methyl ester carboxylesterase
VLESVTRRRLALPERGVEIALLDWGGEGPLALLHHANGFCAALWDLVAAPLRRHYRVVAMDARGHGDSSKPDGEGAYEWHHFGEDVAAVARRLAEARGEASLALGLGHSFGGTAILMAAAADPSLFDRIVLVDPVLLPPPGSPIDPQRVERKSRLVERAEKRRHEWESREEARAWFAEKELFQDWEPRALDLYVAEALADRPSGGVALKCAGPVEAAIFGAGGRLDAGSVAERVSTPAELLWATRGDFPRAAYEAIAARMGNARIRDVDAGHLVPMERPDLVVEAVLATGVQRSTG